MLVDLMPAHVRACSKHVAILRLIEDVTFPGYRFTAVPAPAGGFHVFARFMAPCSVEGGEPQEWTTRKWFISQHSCRSEVVATMLKLVLTSLEHEARENFKFQGVAVFDPHVDVFALKEAVAAGRRDTRTPLKVAA